VKHTLSPIVEYALVAVVASYGLLAIYLVSLQPLAVATLSPVVALLRPVSLDTDAWTRWDDQAYGYAFGAPPGWTVDQGDPASVRIGRSAKERAAAPDAGQGIQVQAATLEPRQQIENIAAADFEGLRSALYDVSVDGRPALFAIAFVNGRIRRQAVYVSLGPRALIARAAVTDPAVFSAFVSTVKFYVTDLPKKSP
jgi:hypothetical protein